MKEIYSFIINKKVSKEKIEETDKGKLVSTIEEDVPVEIILKKPSRLESEEADMIYSIEYGKCVRAGVLTKALVEKLYDEKEKSGILSDDFNQKYVSLYTKFFNIQNEYTKLDLSDKKTDEDKKRLETLAIEYSEVEGEIRSLELARNSIFQNTAETKAQNKTITWLTLFLTYFKDNSNIVPFFKGETFEDKLSHYDELIEDADEFTLSVIDKMAYFVSLYYLGRATTKEDFDAINASLSPNKEEKGIEESSEKELTEKTKDGGPSS